MGLKSQKEFAENFEKFSRDKNIFMDDNLKEYAEYSSLIEGIEATKLIEEIESYAREIVRFEVGNEKFSREKMKLFDVRRELFLMGKIMRFEFSEKDWKSAKLIFKENGTLGKVLKNAERFGELSE